MTSSPTRPNGSSLSTIGTLGIGISLVIGICGLGIPQRASATGEGTIIIQQDEDRYLGSWGLGGPTGTFDGESKLFTSDKKPAGNYAFTITPPAGALATVEVYNDDTLTFTSPRQKKQTVNGTLGSGGTLEFRVDYDFVLMGKVSVTTNPDNVPFILTGPRGVERGTSNIEFTNQPEGTYVIEFEPRSPCLKPRPISRAMQATETTPGRLAFSTEINCGGASSTRESSSDPVSNGRIDPRDASAKKKAEEAEKDEPVEPATPSREDIAAERKAAREKAAGERPTSTRREVQQSPITVSVSAPSKEVPAGGRASLNITVKNISDNLLTNLTVDLNVQRTQISGLKRGGKKTTNSSAQWTITSLPKGETWNTTISATLDEGIGNGDIVIANVNVSGNDVNNVPRTDLSAQTRFGAIKQLPPTGAALQLMKTPLDLIILAGVSLSQILALTIGALGSFARKLW